MKWSATVIIQINWHFEFPEGQSVSKNGFDVIVDCGKSCRWFETHAQAVKFARSLLPSRGGAVYEDFTNRAIIGPSRMPMDQQGPRPWAYEKIDYMNSVPGRAVARYIDEDGVGSHWTWEAFDA